MSILLNIPEDYNREVKEDNKTTQYELFPDIALGDAPAEKGKR